MRKCYIYNRYIGIHFNHKRHSEYIIDDWNNTVDPFFQWNSFDCDYVSNFEFTKL